MDFRKLRCITKHEFHVTAVNKAFVIMTILGPFLLAAIAVLPGLLASQPPEIKADTTVALIGLEPELVAQLNTRLDGTNIAVYAADDPAAQRRAVESGDIQALLMVGSTSGRWPDVESLNYYSKTGTDVAISQTLSAVIGSIVVAQRMQQAGLDAARVQQLSRTPSLRSFRLDNLSPDGQVTDDSGGGDPFLETFMTTIAFVMMIYMTVLIYGQMIGRSVLTEKTAKTVEVMLSSVSPVELLFGKILGRGVAGLIQYALWLGIALLLVGVIGPAFDIAIPAILNAGNFAFLLVFFVLAFFLYSAAYGALGAGSEDEQHFGQLSMPVMIFLIVPMVLVSYLMTNPDSVVTIVLSYVPMTAPIVMLMRVLIAQPAWWEVAISIALMVATIAAVVVVAARIFRVGILLTGKRYSFVEVLRWAR